jgi:pimeloyl-ACP methyl ester carboxylesterase
MDSHTKSNKYRPAVLSRRSAGLLASGAAVGGLGSTVKIGKAMSKEPTQRFMRGYAMGPFGQIHYLDTQVGVPLVLCHQSPMSLRQFDAVYKPLSDQGIRAIGIDSPGFGNSEPADGLPSMEQWARVIPPVLDQLGIEKTNILGNHTGAMLVTEFSLRYPDRVNKLILNGAMIITDQERKERLERLEVSRTNSPYDPDGKHLGEAFQRRKAFYGPGAKDEVITRYIVDRFTGVSPSWYGPYAAYMYDHTEAVKKIKHPTMILVNTGDGIYEFTMRALELRPDFSNHVIEGGGVDITDQKTEEWVQAVADFILS